VPESEAVEVGRANEIAVDEVLAEFRVCLRPQPRFELRHSGCPERTPEPLAQCRTLRSIVEGGSAGARPGPAGIRQALEAIQLSRNARTSLSALERDFPSDASANKPQDDIWGMTGRGAVPDEFRDSRVSPSGSRERWPGGFPSPPHVGTAEVRADRGRRKHDNQDPRRDAGLHDEIREVERAVDGPVEVLDSENPKRRARAPARARTPRGKNSSLGRQTLSAGLSDGRGRSLESLFQRLQPRPRAVGDRSHNVGGGGRVLAGAVKVKEDCA